MVVTTILDASKDISTEALQKNLEKKSSNSFIKILIFRIIKIVEPSPAKIQCDISSMVVDC